MLIEGYMPTIEINRTTYELVGTYTESTGLDITVVHNGTFYLFFGKAQNVYIELFRVSSSSMPC